MIFIYEIVGDQYEELCREFEKRRYIMMESGLGGEGSLSR
jgi:hypothetical protein